MAKARTGTAQYAKVRWFFFLLKFFTGTICVGIAGLAAVFAVGSMDKSG